MYICEVVVVVIVVYRASLITGKLRENLCYSYPLSVGRLSFIEIKESFRVFQGILKGDSSCPSGRRKRRQEKTWSWKAPRRCFPASVDNIA